MSMVYKTVLAYALQTPHEVGRFISSLADLALTSLCSQQLGEVQKDLHIAQEGSFQLQVSLGTRHASNLGDRITASDSR